MHDARGLETRRTEAAGTPAERTIATQWHPTFRLPTRITEPGQRTDFTYDGQGRLLSRTVTDPATGNSRTTTYTYTPEGLLETTDGPRTDVSDVTTRSYDAQGNLTSVTEALGHVTQITAHDASGRPTSIQDPNGVVTDLTYDARGRIISHTLAGLTTSFDYDAAGNLIRVTLPDGSFLDYTYDPAHRLTAIADNLGNRIEYTLDAAGNRTREDVRDPSGALRRTQSRVYNALSRLVQHIGGEGQTSAFAYDANGNQTQVTDPLGNPTARAFDALNRLVSTEDALSGLTELTYDARDNLVSVTNPRGLVTTYVYDGLDNRIERTSPDTGTTTLTYDAAGNRASETDARGVTTHFTYDTSGHLLAESDAAGNPLKEYVYLDGLLIALIAPETGGGGGGGTSELVLDNAGATVAGTWPASTSTPGFEGADYQYHEPNGAPPGSVVVDNADGGFSARGEWTHSTVVSGFEGADYQYEQPDTPPPEARVVDNTDGGFSVTGTWPDSTAVSGFEGTDYQSHEPEGPPPGSVVLDNTDTGFSTIGTWLSSSSTPGFEGSDYQVHAAGSGANSATWALPVPAAGDYEVYARWTAHSNRASNAKYTVQHAGGADTVTVSQQVDGGQWNLLGTYAFDSGTAQVALTDAADGYVIADAVELVPVGAAPNTATWTFDIPTSGDYEVHAKWTAHPNRATDATYTVHHAGGATSVAVDQQQNGGEWQPIGTYTFDAGPAQVSLTDQADGVVVADAVQVVPVGTAPNTATWTLAIPASGDYDVYARWTAHPNRATDAPYTVHHSAGATAVAVNQQLDTGQWNLLGTFTFDTGGDNPRVTLTDEADGIVIADAVMFLPAGSATANSVTWNPNLSSPAQYEVYAKWTAHANRASDATYTVHHALGSTSIAVDQRASGGTWNPLGTFDLDGASSIELRDTADGIVVADAIRLVQVGAPPPTGPAGIFYVHADHLGTPKVATDATQGIAWAADYLPYGQAQVTAEAVRLNVRFPGQYFDAETGLHYNHHRDYNPILARYIESDPIGLNGGLNTYAYVANNPLRFIDPLGLAFFAKRPLAGMPWMGPASCNPIDDRLNTEISHEQLFFEDGKSPSNIGFFDDGTLKTEPTPTGYRCRSRKFNDCIMRKAVANTGPLPSYCIIGQNCQTWAERVREEYARLAGDRQVQKECQECKE